MFSCEYCKVFKNTYFEKHLQMAASASVLSSHFIPIYNLNLWMNSCLSVYSQISFIQAPAIPKFAARMNENEEKICNTYLVPIKSVY